MTYQTIINKLLPQIDELKRKAGFLPQKEPVADMLVKTQALTAINRIKEAIDSLECIQLKAGIK